MTTSLRQPTLVDKSIAAILKQVNDLLMQSPEVGDPVENCRCELPCRDEHPGMWVRYHIVANGRKTGIRYWSYHCLFGCPPGPRRDHSRPE